VVIPPSAQLNPEEAFTVCVWANVDPGSSGYRSPITSRDDSPQRGYIIYANPSNVWQFWIGTGAGWNSATGPAVDFGEWTHVAAVYSTGEQKLYINGALSGQSTATISINTQQKLTIGAGASEGPGNYFFVGKIDDVRIYERTLPQEEIAWLAGRIKPFDEPF
jgi:hypothetical protein